MMLRPLLVFLLAGITVTAVACGRKPAPETAVAGGEVLTESESPLADGEVENTTFAEDLNVVLLAMTRLPTGIYYREVEPGTGVPASPGREVLITYIAYLADGTEVDRTPPGGQPLAFKLGEGQVIRGWDIGVRGMRTGGTRQLVVPSRFAYGNREVGKVPAGSVMVFLVRLDRVR
jgi:FKBP-type peptidyl-prolyl cis-trans isomerase